MGKIYESILKKHKPAKWDVWDEKEAQREHLWRRTSEYKGIEKLVKNKKTFPITINGIERIQNPFLWGCYQLKKTEYRATAKSTGFEVREMRLFHCTSEDNIHSIIQDNLDWRRFTRTKFGRGVSFSSSASYANLQANKFIGKSRAMIVAKVLVGLSIGGHEDMNIPPKRFDTTTGNGTKVWVKYADHEFYPEYIVYYDTPEIDYGPPRRYVRW